MNARYLSQTTLTVGAPCGCPRSTAHPSLRKDPFSLQEGPPFPRCTPSPGPGQSASLPGIPSRLPSLHPDPHLKERGFGAAWYPGASPDWNSQRSSSDSSGHCSSGRFPAGQRSVHVVTRHSWEGSALSTPLLGGDNWKLPVGSPPGLCRLHPSSAAVMNHPCAPTAAVPEPCRAQ